MKRNGRLIAAVTGSRGEWGYIRPILRLIEEDPDLDYRLIVTNMHLLPEFGLSIREIEEDGFRVAERLFMTFDGYTGVTMAKSLGAFLFELPTALDRMRPDILLLAGDRGEQLMAALAGCHLGIPVAHIQAGELSGNVDGIVRHAITKLAHVHFAANESFAERVLRIGEQPFRVHVTGAPLVDELEKGLVTGKEELSIKYGLKPDEPLLLMVQHSVTEEEEEAGVQVAGTVSAVLDVRCPTVIVYPNSDAGSHGIRAELNRIRRPNVHFHRNLPRCDYLGLMKSATAMVGNSSSGIMEAPTFGTPAVNVGRRQNGRPQGANVINVGYGREEVAGGLKRAMSAEFRELARRGSNPYGDGRASERIVSILKNTIIDEKLLRKEMTY